VSPIRYTIQERQQLPADLDWLTLSERRRHDGFRFAKRRGDWLLGRWAGKVTLLELAGLPPQDGGRIEIATAPDGAPLTTLDGELYPVTLSLSHSHGRAMAAAMLGNSALGCDIELVERRSTGFVDTYFTAAETLAVQQAKAGWRDELITMIWSAKESTLKALRTGLRADTRSIEVVADADDAAGGWRSARTTAADDGEFDCVWRRDDGFVITLVTRGAADNPKLIAP